MGYGPGGVPSSYSDEVLAHPLANEYLLRMGITSENVAADFGVTRKAQDAFAATSFQKAAAAQKAGKFKAEILLVKTKMTVKGNDGSETQQEVLVDADDGIRDSDGMTAESLAKLKPGFTKDGCTHAGKYLCFSSTSLS
jgi:acetyl-CoA acyltransferase 1